MLKAKVNEIFTSIQGEGKYVGEQQCFIRFYDCNLKCEFCDTKIYTYTEYFCEDLLLKIKELIAEKKVINTVSLTGGEPLLQRDFLLEFLPKLKQEGLNTYLETNGVLFNELFDIIDYVDIIAMDIKLPSSTKEKGFWKEHAEFLKIAKTKEVFVKLIICLDTTLDDLKKAVDLVLKIDPKIVFILQPNTEQLGREMTEKLQSFKKYSKEFLLDVRVIPQSHKIVGVK